ncbi:cation:proton antiporter regulatory subunit [Nocardia cyriacigeorgica]|uniref:cation:proton antiporter regulatory subunit n=1 Tax=Nocardia cyriacigeorgica TaxID=135487 RepID=UPI001895B5D7|nr:cation:proton antiporter regulatory subunit [Nocardia cyriacigeorgica]MBF6455250.1 cation:proton antiporter regulatory subunit [Nocardia cyriacigeorgica]MBF6554008.1 cation:proton antiporter regulatory subunit [Nocardia cyriacigeorgica]
MNVEVTPLPGIGVRKDFPLKSSGRRVGVVDHRDGTIDLIVSKPDNPDVTDQISLSAREAAMLANLLGAPQLVAQLNEEHSEFEGVTTKQLTLRGGSVYDGRLLGETRMRTRTMTSIVAVVRAGHAIASPGPDFLFAAGDVLVVVGTAEGLSAAGRVLVDG